MVKSTRHFAAAVIGLLALGAWTVALPAGAQDEPYVSGPERGDRNARAAGPGGPMGRGRLGPGHGFGPGHDGGPGARMFALRQLDLSEEQRTEIHAILEQERDQAEAYREEMRSLRAQLEEQIETDPFDETAVRAKALALGALGVDMAVLRARQAGQVREVLTPEQLGELERLGAEREAFREQRRRRFERHRGPRSGS